MKRLTIIAALVLFLVPLHTIAQTTEYPQTMNYTRGSGFVIRPELNNGLLATLGYQINPHIMIEGSIGFGLGDPAAITTVVGARAYASDRPWTIFFDYRIGTESVSGYSIARHTFIAGIAYKDFDLGGGVIFGTDGTASATFLSISIGYNIRCYTHR
ncbi:MAG: hypothetical protein IJ761_03040 [Bacteroidales bacterium]|nr:hypothetical protein [Bacteroidales bacterium]